MKHPILFALALAASLPAASQPVDPALVERAKAECRARLLKDIPFRDPESVRIDSIERAGAASLPSLGGARARLYAMKVNAKNAYGGYTGAREYHCLTDADDETRVLLVRPDLFGAAR